MKTNLLAVALLVGSACTAQTIDNPKRLPTNATNFPFYEWCTTDGKILSYHGDTNHILEYGWVVIYEVDGDFWKQEEDDVRPADHVVLLNDALGHEAWIWDLSNNKRFLILKSPESDQGALFLCPKNYTDIASLLRE